MLKKFLSCKCDYAIRIISSQILLSSHALNRNNLQFPSPFHSLKPYKLKRRMKFVNIVICIFKMLLLIPVIRIEIWLSTEEDNSCIKILQWPLILYGVLILVLPLAAHSDDPSSSFWLPISQILAVFTLIVSLPCFIILSYNICVHDCLINSTR